MKKKRKIVIGIMLAILFSGTSALLYLHYNGIFKHEPSMITQDTRSASSSIGFNADDYIPGCVGVTIKDDYINDFPRVEQVFASVGATINHEFDEIRDIGIYELHVELGKEKQAAEQLRIMPEIETAAHCLQVGPDVL